MPPKIYISRRVADLERTRKFWTALGYDNFPQVPENYRDKTMPTALADGVWAVFMTDKLFAHVGMKPMAFPSESPECIVTLAVESRERVDELIAKAVAAGGRAADGGEVPDMESMHTRAFTDPDGHWWEFQWCE